jgi:hypothetical protein
VRCTVHKMLHRSLERIVLCSEVRCTSEGHTEYSDRDDDYHKLRFPTVHRPFVSVSETSHRYMRIVLSRVGFYVF